MKTLKIHTRIFLLIGILLLNTNIFSQDPNFYIFLCFGQSNMEGQGTIESQDQTVDSRFRVMEAINCSNLGRSMGTWYTATPPLCRCYTGLSPADYFGRTLVENLPSNIRIGIVHVAVAGCKIELFDKDNYQSYVATVADWMKNIINEYGGNPYGRLVDIARLSQQDGVIKGILLHQGESNVGDSQWPSKVKGIYDDLINDLGLDPNSVPLLAGEVVNADQGGVCASVNSIIAQLPQTLSNSYVISSSGCTAQSDYLHFNSAGYRELGRRYAVQMLSLLGQEPSGESIWLEAECGTVGSLWNTVSDGNASNGEYVTVQSGNNSTESAPTSASGQISYTFNVSEGGSYSLWVRVTTPNGNDDSFWISVDGGSWFLWNNIGPNSSWAWEQAQTYSLSAGSHTLTVAYREDGALLDKILISNTGATPSGEGSAASNCGGTTGDYTIAVRAMGTNGSEQITLAVGGTAVQTWTLGTSMGDYTATTSLSGNITVEFTNDDGTNRDVQVDYIQINGATTLQAEDQATNTGVWQNSACGGQYSEWLHCNGYIEFSAFKSAGATKVEDYPANNNILLYPNPAGDILNISVPGLGEGTAVLSIYNIDGKAVKTAIVEKGENSINLHELETGLYILKINNSNQMTVKKFLKK